MKQTLSVIYGLVAYVLFLAAFLYFIAFTLNVAPHSISGSASVHPALTAIIDIGLITLFGLQHSIMARPAFKRWLTRFVPQHLERSTFVLISTAILGSVVLAWQPIDGELWSVAAPASYALIALSLLGFSAVPVVSFLTDHFALFGLRQVYEYATGRPPSKPAFKERWVYRQVRHPMMLGFLVAFWCTPLMTVGHLVFALTMTAYIAVGVYFEERTLVHEHGQAYRDYQNRVPKFVPGTKAEEPVRVQAARAR